MGRGAMGEMLGKSWAKAAAQLRTRAQERAQSPEKRMNGRQFRVLATGGR
jgi:hypothetical protein